MIPHKAVLIASNVITINPARLLRRSIHMAAATVPTEISPYATTFGIPARGTAR